MLLLLLQLPLAPLPRADVHGTVTGRDGRPFVGAPIFAVGTPVGAVTDLRGVYHLPLPVGSYRLCLRFPGELPVVQEVVVRDSTPITRDLAFTTPVPRRVYPACRQGDSLLVLTPGSLTAFDHDEERDVLNSVEYAAIRAVSADLRAEASLPARTPGGASPTPGPVPVPILLLLTPADEPSRRWLEAVVEERVVDGVCHAREPVGCVGDLLASIVHVDSVRSLTPDTAVVTVSRATTIPNACRRGDYIPYHHSTEEWFLVREDYEWRRVGTVFHWPFEVGHIEFSGTERCPP